MRILVERLTPGEVTVRGDEHHYISRVHRAKVSQQVELFDGEGKRASAVIVDIQPDFTVFDIGDVEDVPDESPRIRTLIPLIKGDRMDTCIEKLVEVGVSEIVIWPAERAVVRLDGDRLDGRIAKFQAAAQAAARQCGRATIPTVTAATSLADAIAGLPETGPRFVLDPTSDLHASEALPGVLETTETIALVTGPEGGLAPSEIDALKAHRFLGITMGPRTLRAETAPVIAVALVRALTTS